MSRISSTGRRHPQSLPRYHSSQHGLFLWYWTDTSHKINSPCFGMYFADDCPYSLGQHWRPSCCRSCSHTRCDSGAREWSQKDQSTGTHLPSLLSKKLYSISLFCIIAKSLQVAWDIEHAFSLSWFFFQIQIFHLEYCRFRWMSSLTTQCGWM